MFLCYRFVPLIRSKGHMAYDILSSWKKHQRFLKYLTTTGQRHVNKLITVHISFNYSLHRRWCITKYVHMLSLCHRGHKGTLVSRYFYPNINSAIISNHNFCFIIKYNRGPFIGHCPLSFLSTKMICFANHLRSCCFLWNNTMFLSFLVYFPFYGSTRNTPRNSCSKYVCHIFQSRSTIYFYAL